MPTTLPLCWLARRPLGQKRSKFCEREGSDPLKSSPQQKRDQIGANCFPSVSSRTAVVHPACDNGGSGFRAVRR